MASRTVAGGRCPLVQLTQMAKGDSIVNIAVDDRGGPECGVAAPPGAIPSKLCRDWKRRLVRSIGFARRTVRSVIRRGAGIGGYGCVVGRLSLVLSGLKLARNGLVLGLV